MAIKPAKHFLDTMAGAPVLNGIPGSLIAVIDSLVNGFNLLALDSLVVSGGVLTGAKAGHGFVVDQVITTSANEAALIGEWTVTSVTSGTFTADATGVGDVTGTGTKTAKAAPAGWSKVYSATNKAVYKSADPTANGIMLRVDDTYGTYARVTCYESMTDVDTGSAPTPSAAQLAGGGYWHKSAVADASPRPWSLFADSLAFYFSRGLNVSSNFALDGFGQVTSEKPGDAYGSFLAASSFASSNSTNSAVSALCDAAGASQYGGVWIPRSYSQLGGSVVGQVFSFRPHLSALGSGDTSYGRTFPSEASNGLLVGVATLAESAGPIRALALPGLLHTPQKVPLNHNDKSENIAGLPGRKLIAISAIFYSSGAAQGRVFVDLTGPWR